MATIFTKIVRGEIPSYKVAEDERYYVDYVFDLDDEELAGLMVFAKRVAKAIGRSVPCKRVGVAVLGLEVPHAHVHLVPLTEEGDMDFSNPKKSFTAEEMAACAEEIRGNL